MSYRTVLVHVDDSARAAVRIQVAAAIAGRCGGHLVGAAVTGVSRFLYQASPSGDKDPNLALHQAFLREHARQALANFTREAKASGIASYEERVIDDEAGTGISLHARAADLVVLGQAEPGPLADFPSQVVIDSGRPVLILPHAGTLTGVGRQVLVSWDASREAARALLLALPLLVDAARVHVAVFDTGSNPRTLGDAASADPLPFLARHAVHAELSVHAVGGARRRAAVGDALLSLATDLPADLLVMGAYGHSRFRETILGGVTRTVLEAMTIPVLMAH
jgi:nucleotide-binding universal stress UspA family protein